MILVSNFGTTRQPPSQISHEFNPNFEFLSRMSSLCGIQFSFLFRDGYLIFSLDLLRFDVADLWPKFQFDSLNFEGIIRFEVSFFFPCSSFLPYFRPSFLLFLHRKRREAGGYGWTRYIGTHRSRAAEALQRSCFFRGYNEDVTYSHAPHLDHTNRHCTTKCACRCSSQRSKPRPAARAPGVRAN